MYDIKFKIGSLVELSEMGDSSIYDEFKIHFLYNSNKLEGSTFNEEQLQRLLKDNVVIGEHDTEDVEQSLNSLNLFYFVVSTLSEPLTPFLLCEWHSCLFKNTKYEKWGQTGKFKMIPNRLSGIELKTAEPYEVPEKIDQLLSMKISTVEDIANFHQNFEHIHPFIDGNGRIGRFIIMRQCIEHEIDLVVIDSKDNKEYKGTLYTAETTGNITDLTNIFRKSQEQLDMYMSGYLPYIEQMNETNADDIHMKHIMKLDPRYLKKDKGNN